METEIPKLWMRFGVWMAVNAPAMMKELMEHQLIATDEEFQLVEESIGVALPADFKALYKVQNGGNGSVLVDGHEWLSIEEVLAEWKIWKELLENGDFKEEEVQAQEGIEPVWWHPRWIPFTHDGGGNHLCLDLAPSSKGTMGQVIQVWHDSDRRVVLAPSFLEWLEGYISRVEQGEFVYDADLGGVFHKDVL